MAFTEIDIRKYCEESPLSLIGDQWALLSAGDKNGWNTMTVSWGQLGVLWNKNVVTVYIRPQRHTLKCVEENENFSLTSSRRNTIRHLPFAAPIPAATATKPRKPA